MCGIVGYTGYKEAAPILLAGLEKLEYRGYDSSGIAVANNKELCHVKKKGRLTEVKKYMERYGNLKGTCGIGHTRWATHGEPTDANAHPHFNQQGTIGIVHNGIIENYQSLKEKMSRRGYTFSSDTDSEVIVHMLDYYQTEDLVETIDKVLMRLTGSYALEIMFAQEPDTIFCVRKDSPLVIGTGDRETYIASDAPAILAYTRDVYYPENGEIAVVKGGQVTFCQDGEVAAKETVHLDLDDKAAEKGSYNHFMMKEIEEQPEALERLLAKYGQPGKLTAQSDEMKNIVNETKRIHMVACGSAYHAAMAGKYVIEKLANIPVEVDLASEFRYRSPILGDGSLVVIISQSGETADSLAALREGKKRGATVLGIVNVEGSSIAREADAVLYTYAGPEISVATTKGYSTQVFVLYLMAMELAWNRRKIQEDTYRELLEELEEIPGKIKTVFKEKENIQKAAAKYFAKEHVFYIGRGLDYAAVLEGALKLKEISYIHGEAYAAGELKHGTIALLEEDSLVVVAQTQPELYDKVKSNIIETKSRGAKIYGIHMKDENVDTYVYDLDVTIPPCHPLFVTSVSMIPMQLFAYYVSVARGIDVDKPRNLAKSVTVE